MFVLQCLLEHSRERQRKTQRNNFTFRIGTMEQTKSKENVKRWCQVVLNPSSLSMTNFQHGRIILLSPFWKITNTTFRCVNSIWRIFAINSHGVAFEFQTHNKISISKWQKKSKCKVKMSKIIFVVSVAFFIAVLVSHGMISI